MLRKQNPRIPSAPHSPANRWWRAKVLATDPSVFVTCGDESRVPTGSPRVCYLFVTCRDESQVPTGSPRADYLFVTCRDEYPAFPSTLIFSLLIFALFMLSSFPLSVWTSACSRSFAVQISYGFDAKLLVRDNSGGSVTKLMSFFRGKTWTQRDIASFLLLVSRSPRDSELTGSTITTCAIGREHTPVLHTPSSG
jgi:hypothetical protein